MWTNEAAQRSVSAGSDNEVDKKCGMVEMTEPTGSSVATPASALPLVPSIFMPRRRRRITFAGTSPKVPRGAPYRLVGWLDISGGLP